MSNVQYSCHYNDAGGKDIVFDLLFIYISDIICDQTSKIWRGCYNIVDAIGMPQNASLAPIPIYIY